MALTSHSCPKCRKSVLWAGNAAGGRVPCPHCKTLLEGGPAGIRLAGPITTAPRGDARERTVSPPPPSKPEPPGPPSVSPLAILALSIAAVACIVATAFLAGNWSLQKSAANKPAAEGGLRSEAENDELAVRREEQGPGREEERKRAAAEAESRKKSEEDRAAKEAEERKARDASDASESRRLAEMGRSRDGAAPSGLVAAVEGVRHSVVTLLAGEADKATGLGSGFVVGKRRWIVTNLHVVADTTRAVAYRKADDGNVVRGEVEGFVACSPDTDLVLLALEEDWPRDPLRLAPSGPRLGDEVFAIGSPSGLAETVTKGIVSANRTAADIDHRKLAPATRIIQTDASITHGSSGGPLCAASGIVLGINTFGIKDDDAPGFPLHFAVSVEELHRLIKSADGQVRPLSALPRGRR